MKGAKRGICFLAHHHIHKYEQFPASRTSANYSGALPPPQTPHSAQNGWLASLYVLHKYVRYRTYRILCIATPLGAGASMKVESRRTMANWSLICKKCQFIFPHSEIGDSLAECFVSEKPKFPPEGVEWECPRCKARFTYVRYDLIYQKSSSSFHVAGRRDIWRIR